MKVVLLPGLDGTGLLFEPLIECLPPDFAHTVLALPNDVPMGYRDLVARIGPLLPQDEPFVLLGESFSGPLALLLAAERPAGLAGVILCASFVTNPTLVPSIARHLAGSWLFRFTPTFIQAKALLGGYSSARLLALLAQAHRQVAPAVMAERIRAILTVDVTSALSTVHVPLAYIRGAHDHVVPARNLERIRAIRPDIRTFTVKAPHLVLQVRPEASSEAIAAFVSSSS